MNVLRTARSPRVRQRGVALLGAVLLAAIVVALAVGIGQRGRFGIAAATRVIEASDAGAVFAQLEDAARQALHEDAVGGNLDAATDAWHTDTLTVGTAGVSGEARLEDLQGRFNLNNLEPTAQASVPFGGTPAAARAQATTEAPAAPGRPAAPAGALSPPGDGLVAAADTGNAGSAQAVGDAGADAGQADPPTPAVDVTRLSVAERREQLAMLPAPYLPQRGANATAGRDTAGATGPDAIGPAGAATSVMPATSPAAATSADTAGEPGPGASAALAALPTLAAVRGDGAAAGTQSATGAPQLSAWEVSIARFSLLLHALELDDDIVPAILDWLDADSDTRFPGGAEDDYYMGLEHPYRAANRAFSDLSELRLVRGVTDEIYARLAPLLCVLPARTDINVNLAPPEVLMALGPGIDRATADMLVNARETQPFQAVGDFRAFPLLLGRPLLSDGLVTDSRWFALSMHASVGASEFAARSVLARAAPDQITVLSRQRGFFDD